MAAPEVLSRNALHEVRRLKHVLKLLVQTLTGFTCGFGERGIGERWLTCRHRRQPVSVVLSDSALELAHQNVEHAPVRMQHMDIGHTILMIQVDLLYNSCIAVQPVKVGHPKFAADT